MTRVDDTVAETMQAAKEKAVSDAELSEDSKTQEEEKVEVPTEAAREAVNTEEDDGIPKVFLS